MELQQFFARGGQIFVSEDVTVVRVASGDLFASASGTQDDLYDELFENVGDFFERDHEENWQAHETYDVKFGGSYWRGLSEQAVRDKIASLEEV